MARCCGSTGSCSCKMEAGRNISITGMGSSQDPFVIASDVFLTVEDSDSFDLGLTGNGTLASPWTLTITYADDSRLADIPDVDADAPTNGQVLAWSDALDKWVPVAPTTAAAGAVNTDTSLDGDGSVGDPLEVVPDTTRYIQTSASGVGLSDAGLNRLIRPFADATVRAAASPAPTVGAISMLNTAPGRLDFWDGDSWEPITNGIQLAVQPGEFLALSGSYADGTVVQYVAQLSAETDVDGVFEVISDTDLTNYAGVLSVSLQETGTLAYRAVLDTDTDRIIGTAYRLDDGEPYASVTVTALVTALLY